MSDPYLGEIRIVGFDFAPRGWAACDGQLLSITQHPELFALIGTAYGGDGVDDFALPDMRGRTAVNVGNSSTYDIGDTFGTETHQLTEAELPSHSHTISASDTFADNINPAGREVAPTENPATGLPRPFFGSVGDLDMHASSFTSVGSDTAHTNTMPSIVVNFIVSLTGFYPRGKND